MEETNNKPNDKVFLKHEDVKKTLRKPPYERNEVLYNHIYYESKLSINKLAKLLNVNRQYIWGILNRRLMVSFSMARKICNILGVKELHTLFRQDDIYYPGFKTAKEVNENETNISTGS